MSIETRLSLLARIRDHSDGMTDTGLDATAPDPSPTTTKSTAATAPPDATEIDRQIDSLRNDLSRLRAEILDDLTGPSAPPNLGPTP